MAETIRTHKISFNKTGECDRCGACEKDWCPHFSMVGGLATCDVYATRSEVCKFCTSNESSNWNRDGKPVTHERCEGFPNSPFCRVIREGLCNYKFEPITKEDKDKFDDFYK